MKRTLSLDQLKEGRLKALNNATDLFKEASLLFDNHHWARSLFLSITAGEELGKYIMVTSALLGTTIKPKSFDWQKFWRRYSSHRSKSENILAIGDVENQIAKGRLIHFTAIAILTTDIEKNRQAALYSDFKEGGFCSPSDIVTKEQAKASLEWLKYVLDMIKNAEAKGLSGIDTMTTSEIAEYLSSVADLYLRTYGDR